MKKIIITLLSIMTMHTANSAILLDTVQNKKYEDILEEAQSIRITDEGTIYVTSEEGAVFLTIEGQSISKTSLSPSIFEDTDLAGLSILDNGNYVVVNNDSGKVGVISPDFKLIKRFSDSGSDPGNLDRPNGVATSINNRIYIADTDNHRISVFNDQGVFLFSFGDSMGEKANLNYPTHIALDAKENVYVLESRDKERMSIFDRFGTLLKQITAQDLSASFGAAPDLSAMTVDLNGNIYFADYDSRKIAKLNWQDNSVSNAFGSLGQSPGQFRLVSQMSINTKGILAILDIENQKVETFQLEDTKFSTPITTNVLKYKQNYKATCSKLIAYDIKRSFCLTPEKGVKILSNEGEVIGDFAEGIKNPTHIHAGNTHIALIQENTLYTYTLEGESIYKVGRYGISEGGFDDPIFVFAINDLTYVADENNNRVQVFSKEGQFLKQYKGDDKPDSPFETIGPIAVSNDGRLFVADQNGKALIQVSNVDSGLLMYSIKIGAGKYRYEGIKSIAIDQQNRLYVLGKTDDNPFKISLVDNDKTLVQFGSESGNGISQAFKQAANLSVISTNKNTILINDTEAKRVQIYDYLEIPESAFGLKVNGDNTNVVLNWTKPTSKLIDFFEVEASDSEEGTYTKISTQKSSSVQFKTDEVKNYSWFRVVSVSGLGLKAKASKPKQNAYYDVASLFKAKKYTETVVKAEKLLKLFPKNADLLNLKAQSLFLNKEYRDAIPEFKKLTQFEKYKNVALKTQVEAYYALEEYLDAKSLIEEVLADQPKEIEPYILCTELSLVLSDAIGAVTCAEDGLTNHETHAGLRYLLGKAYIAAGIADEGILEFETILEATPEDHLIRIKIANDLYELESYEDALSHFDKVVSDHPKSTDAINGKAKTLIALKQFDDAKSLAIKLSGNKKSKKIKSDGYYFLGQIAYNQNKYTEAVLRFTRASKYNAQAVSSWALLAQSYIQINKLAKGVKALNQGIKKNPEAYELYETLGRIELAQEHYPEAIKALNKAVELNANSAESQTLLAKTLFDTRNYRKAATHATLAAKINPKDIDTLTLQADIASLQGKAGSAIDYLKTAIEIKPSSADLQYRLGKVYQVSNIYDSAKKHLEKAAGINPSWSVPQVALGNLYLKRRLFDQAIAAFEKSIELDPTDDNKAALNTAFAEQKRALEFSNNAPQLVLQDLNIGHVFSAAYKRYTDEPIGKVTLENVGATDFGNLTLSFQIKEFMDFPEIQKIPIIKGESKSTFDIKATFNNKILEVDEDTGVQVEVKLSYLRDGQKDDLVLTQAMTIYGKNAMVWGDSFMVGSFVTPKDDSLRNYVREVVNKYKPDDGPLNGKLVTAMSLFSSLNAHGTKYIIDPNTPYTELRDDQVDYVQFPRETLRLKSGDCDDLSVLFSAGLENLGISTALIEVPGHLLMMFDTGLPVKDASLVSRDFSLLAEKNGTVWIPIETTMITNSFSEAWAEGARKYQKAVAENNLGIIDLSEAWAVYKPVTLKKSDYKISLPNEAQTKKLVGRENKVLLTKSIDRLILPYQAMVSSDPSNVTARMQIAILYSRFGLYDEAEILFDELTELSPDNVSVLNNKGNFFLLQERYDEALKVYNQAEVLDANDSKVQLNMAMAYYGKGSLNKASSAYSKAISIDSSIQDNYNAFSKLLSR